MSNMLLGRIDWIDFPELKLQDIACKIDTGAYTSSIHCHHVKLVERRGKESLRFRLLSPGHKQYVDREFEVRHFCEKIIRNSSGAAEQRYVIHSHVLIYDTLFAIDLTLADREEMKFPVLIGRKFLQDNKIIVDVNKHKLSYKTKKAAEKNKHAHRNTF